jgi:hypothetical protein
MHQGPYFANHCLKSLWELLKGAVGASAYPEVQSILRKASPSFNGYLLSTFDAPSTVQGTMARAATETNEVPTV